MTNGALLRYNAERVMVLLPCLSEKMRMVGATNISLAEAAGTSAAFVQKARNGKPVMIDWAVALYQALNTRKFTRSPIGPHTWTTKRRLYAIATR